MGTLKKLMWRILFKRYSDTKKFDPLSNPRHSWSAS